MSNYDLKSTDNVEVKEFMIESDGYKIIGFIGKGNYFNWLTLPQLGIGMELSRLDDVFWNREQFSKSIEDPVLIDLFMDVLSELAELFSKDEQNCFYKYSGEQCGTGAF